MSQPQSQRNNDYIARSSLSSAASLLDKETFLHPTQKLSVNSCDAMCEVCARLVIILPVLTPVSQLSLSELSDLLFRFVSRVVTNSISCFQGSLGSVLSVSRRVKTCLTGCWGAALCQLSSVGERDHAHV